MQGVITLYDVIPIFCRFSVLFSDFRGLFFEISGKIVISDQVVIWFESIVCKSGNLSQLSQTWTKKTYFCVWFYFRGWGTRSGGRRAHVFDCAFPTQTCPRALCVLLMSHVGHAKEHAFACPNFLLAIWRAVFRRKFWKIGFLAKKYCNLTIKNSLFHHCIIISFENVLF